MAWLPKNEYHRRQYWKHMGYDPDTMTGNEKAPDGAPPAEPVADPGPPRGQPAYKAVTGYSKMLRKRVEASTTITEVEKLEWHCLLDMLESNQPASRFRASKALPELNARAPVVDGPRAAPKKSPEELGRELVRERMARLAGRQDAKEG